MVGGAIPYPLGAGLTELRNRGLADVLMVCCYLAVGVSLEPQRLRAMRIHSRVPAMGAGAGLVRLRGVDRGGDLAPGQDARPLLLQPT